MEHILAKYGIILLTSIWLLEHYTVVAKNIRLNRLFSSVVPAVSFIVKLIFML